jgi:Flp pilus assembly protein TadG
MRDLIFRRVQSRLVRRLPQLAGGGERGAIGVLIAVLIGAGVLVGMGALVVDVGELYQNRAELQNGADAAALAVAKSCVQGTCTPSIATTYADANASKLTGGTADVNQVCGSGSLGGCPASSGKITDCPAAPAAGTNYVDVHTSTELANGSHLLPPVFARTLAGNGSYQGSTVYACAQAEWGAPSSANTIAVTFSACTWDKDTNLGTTFAPPPPYPPNSLPAASLDQVLLLHTTKSNTSCPTEPAGADAPGNFGWTDDTGNCSVTIDNGSYGGNTGVSVTQDCGDAIYNDWLNKTLVFLPVYTVVSGTGTNTTYTLKGFAAFVITGYNLPGLKSHNQGSDWLNSKNNCKGSNVCINGYFTQGLVPSIGSLGGPNLGAYIVKLSG